MCDATVCGCGCGCGGGWVLVGVGGRGCGCGCVEASPTQAVYVVVTCTGAVYVRPERLGVGHASKTAVTKKFVMEGVDTENIDTGSVDA